MEKIKKFLVIVGGVLLLVVLGLFILVYILTYHPSDFQDELVSCKPNTPVLKVGQKIKVLSWNVQFMAGKNYVFYFDVPNMNGPDERPSSKDIQMTIKEVARVIKDENPDVILLQEVDEGSKRTDYENQLVELLKLLPEDYGCSDSAYYWKNLYVPHPRINGSTGLKLATISKYKIESAVRHALPIIPADIISEQFGLKRAVLESRMPVLNDNDLSVMNTHLDAFAQGSDTMEKQIQYLKKLLDDRNLEKIEWLIGGDFNLLPPNVDLFSLYKTNQYLFKAKSEIVVLFNSFKSAIPLEKFIGEDRALYYTHIPNDPDIKGKADRTIDYFFHSDGIQVDAYKVRQNDTETISDHMPLIVEMQISN